ncbi:hypothetical protein Ddye_015883 [Dipteronia dyeriana]|uniref:Uncharacterized protein n=1 Tax=Dipteronia dyeriana TaxID=168575 RepID=A0AAD9U6Q9_9ROSI|nr:hypothetical protein Ddye_015883 [Dipteronia dyeriana]
MGVLRVTAEEGASGDGDDEIEGGSLVRGREANDRDGGRADSDIGANSHDDPSSGEVVGGGRLASSFDVFLSGSQSRRVPKDNIKSKQKQQRERESEKSEREREREKRRVTGKRSANMG